MIKWNKIERSLVQDYRTTFRLMMREAKSRYGTDIINKVFENGETCLHTAVNKAEETSVERRFFANSFHKIFPKMSPR